MFCPWVLMAIAFMPLYEDSRLVTAIKKSAAAGEEVVTRDGHQPLLAHTWSPKQRQRQGQQPLLQPGLQTWSQKQRQKIKREGQRHHMTEKSNWSQLQVIFRSLDRQSCLSDLHCGVFQIDALIIYGELKRKNLRENKLGSSMLKFILWCQNYFLDLDFSSRSEYRASNEPCRASSLFKTSD